MSYTRMTPGEMFKKYKALPEAITYFEGDEVVAVHTVSDDRVIFVDRPSLNYVGVDMSLLKFIVGEEQS